jgi:hypothetical protein
MARVTTKDRGVKNDGNKRSPHLSVTFTVAYFSPWLFYMRLEAFASIPIILSLMKQSRPELLIVDDITPSNATHFVQPLGYAEAMDR